MAVARLMTLLLLTLMVSAATARPLNQAWDFLQLPGSELSGDIDMEAAGAEPVVSELALSAALLNETVTLIELKHDITLTKELPIITRNLTIYGNCSTAKALFGAPCSISGNQTFRIFQVEAPKGEALSFIVRTVALRNATAKSGAAIHFVSGGAGSLEVSGSTFFANQGTGTTGGSAVHTDSNLNLTDSVFVANNGSGPAVYLANRSRAVALQVAGSQFSTNGGGALGSQGLAQPAIFAGNSWIANVNASGAAAIDLTGGEGETSLVNITGDIFVRNHGGEAGALRLHGYRFVVTDTRFFANVASSNVSSGGAIHAEHQKGASFVTSATVIANSAAVGAGIYGDGGSIGICSCVMVANTATQPGGAGNLLFAGDAIAIWPWGAVWGAVGAPITYNYTLACGTAASLAA